MRKKLMKTICTFLACILLLNSTVLAVPVENTSAQSTFSSTLTREPISKITDGEIQSSDIEIVKRDGIKYLLEGNHRVFGALSAGKTILPYVVTREEDSSNHRTTGITEYDSYKECVYDYADGIEYYGGKIGKIDQLRNFNVQDLLAMNNMKNIEECINYNEER